MRAKPFPRSRDHIAGPLKLGSFWGKSSKRVLFHSVYSLVSHPQLPSPILRKRFLFVGIRRIRPLNRQRLISHFAYLSILGLVYDGQVAIRRNTPMVRQSCLVTVRTRLSLVKMLSQALRDATRATSQEFCKHPWRSGDSLVANSFCSAWQGTTEVTGHRASITDRRMSKQVFVRRMRW